MKRRLVLKNKKRFALFLALIVFSFFTFIFANSTYGYKYTPYKTVVVRAGDTLWDIARIHGSNKEVRRFIYEVKKINKLKDNTIYVGTLLKLPINS